MAVKEDSVKNGMVVMTSSTSPRGGAHLYVTRYPLPAARVHNGCSYYKLPLPLHVPHGTDATITQVFWLIGPFFFFTLAFGGVIVPKLNL